jgi:hydrogenase maturation protease
VIGVGNAYRGDDGAGLAAIESVRGRVPDGVRVLTCEDEPTRLIDEWGDAGAALVVDAVSSGAPPGTVHRFDASEDPVPARTFHSSTHAFGLGEAIELARALGRLPRRVVVYGLEGRAFSAGTELSAEVAAAAERVARQLLAELEGAECTSTP